MQIFTSLQVKEIDRFTIENEPVTSIKLMERAATRFIQWFVSHFDAKHPVVVFAGPGNNGGDALAIARLLTERQYSVRVFMVSTGVALSADCAINLQKLSLYLHPEFIDGQSIPKLPYINRDEIIIDGIFGSGLNRPPEEPVASVIRHINQSGARVVSIDIPSGLRGEDNRSNPPENIIKATNTVSFEFPFLSFFMSENVKFTGEWDVISIGLHKEIIDQIKTPYSTIDDAAIRNLLIPREKFSHKGTFGHALVVAGRYGMMGAAVLCGKACLRGGAGLTSMFVPRKGYDIIQASVPEALLAAGSTEEYFDTLPELNSYQGIACGPAIGLSPTTARALHELILQARVPLVLDADALTILSENKKWIKELPPDSVLTPHPKEFDRLAGDSKDMYSRHLRQIEFASENNVIIVLKGAHTRITTPGGESYINTTGNPGMASGGSGDVLTGLLVSLIAQGYSSLNASLIAVYIHGLAADIALGSSSVEALVAGDIIENTGKAFRFVKNQG